MCTHDTLNVQLKHYERSLQSAEDSEDAECFIAHADGKKARWMMKKTLAGAVKSQKTKKTTKKKGGMILKKSLVHMRQFYKDSGKANCSGVALTEEEAARFHSKSDLIKKIATP